MSKLKIIISLRRRSTYGGHCRARRSSGECEDEGADVNQFNGGGQQPVSLSHWKDPLSVKVKWSPQEKMMNVRTMGKIVSRTKSCSVDSGGRSLR